MFDYVVFRSALIINEREARRYYQERLGGHHVVSCHGRNVSIFFESAANHVYTVEVSATNAHLPVIRRRLGPGDYEDRVFSLDRALLMDRILPAVCYYTFSLPSKTTTASRPNRLLYGPRLPDGRYMCVALGPGPSDSWICKTAFPIDQEKWRKLRGARTTKFPP